MDAGLKDSSDLLNIYEKALQPRMKKIQSFLNGLTDTAILEYSLGFDVPNAPDLAKECIIVVMKSRLSESKIMPGVLLELGLHTFERKAMRSQMADPGPHSQKMLRAVKYHHIRILEHAKYVNLTPDPPDDRQLSTEFGAVRFVELDGAEDIIHGVLNKLVDPARPDLGTRPVILLNYDDNDDYKIIQDTMGLPSSIWRNVIGTISTQQIAWEQHVDWRDSSISLPELAAFLKIDFGYEQQGASNFAAYTLIAAIQLVMRPKAVEANIGNQEILNHTILQSQSQIPIWGERMFCTRCGRKDHARWSCYVHPAVLTCSQCGGYEDFMSGSSHDTSTCLY